MTPWYYAAACSGLPTNLFYPDPSDDAGQRAAKDICAGCPVREACLEEALEEEGGRSLYGRHGIRGGLTRTQRVREYRRRTAAARRPPTPPRVVQPALTPPKSDRKRPTFLSAEDRANIARRRLAGEGPARLAREYGITTKTVQRITRAARQKAAA